MKPALVLFATGRNEQNTIRPGSQQGIGIVHAIGIGKPVTISDSVSFAPRAKPIEDPPRFGFVQCKLGKTCEHSALAKTIAIGNQHCFSGYTQHFPDNNVWMLHMVQNRELANDVKTFVSERKCQTGSANQRAGGEHIVSARNTE